MATPEDFVRIVQDTISTSECANPITFEPPDWVIRAMRRAYERGGSRWLPAVRASTGPLPGGRPMTRAQMEAAYCSRCGANPCACDDEDDDPGPHTCVFVAVDDRDECEICGRDSDQFRDLHDSDLERARRRRLAR